MKLRILATACTGIFLLNACGDSSTNIELKESYQEKSSSEYDASSSS